MGTMLVLKESTLYLKQPMVMPILLAYRGSSEIMGIVKMYVG